MKWLIRICLALALIMAVAIGVVMAASESGEVVTLTTADGSETRLWVVQHDGHLWLRSGNPTAGWFARIKQDAAVTVVAGGEIFTATAVPETASRDVINHLMREKYGVADQIIATMFGREDATPIRLQR